MCYSMWCGGIDGVWIRREDELKKWLPLCIVIVHHTKGRCALAITEIRKRFTKGSKRVGRGGEGEGGHLQPNVDTYLVTYLSTVHKTYSSMEIKC